MVFTNEEDPPDSTDLEGWRRAIQSGCLRAFRTEAVVAAIQDLGPTADDAVINALALHASDTILRILRKLVSKDRSNQGADMVDDVHGQLIRAVLSPNSADGKGLREAFIPRIKFRVGDAIRVDDKKRERESPVENLDSAFDPRRADDTSHTRDVESRLYVEEVLSHITNDKKRLAFRLHMEGVPLKSKRTMSIEKAVGVCSKTAGEWINEVQEQLRQIVGEQS